MESRKLYSKRGRQLLQSLFEVARVEVDFWELLLQADPNAGRHFYDSLHCRMYKGRTGQEWLEHWHHRLERIWNLRRAFNRKYPKDSSV